MIKKSVTYSVRLEQKTTTVIEVEQLASAPPIKNCPTMTTWRADYPRARAQALMNRCRGSSEISSRRMI